MLNSNEFIREKKNHSKKDELNNVNDSIPDTFSNDDENVKDVEIKYLKKLIEKYENEVEVLTEALKKERKKDTTEQRYF